jgi:hypothetical protein
MHASQVCTDETPKDRGFMKPDLHNLESAARICPCSEHLDCGWDDCPKAVAMYVDLALGRLTDLEWRELRRAQAADGNVMSPQSLSGEIDIERQLYADVQSLIAPLVVEV